MALIIVGNSTQSCPARIPERDDLMITPMEQVRRCSLQAATYPPL
ncbi:hypothetical protein ACFV2A_31685 [Streptomyces californicus]